MARRTLSVIAAALVMLGALAVREASRAPSAGEVLADAKAFVRDRRSVRFTGTVTTTALGASTKGAVEGVLEEPYRGRVTVAWDDGRREIVGPDALPEYDIAVLLAAARRPTTLGPQRAPTTLRADLDIAEVINDRTRVVDVMTLRATVSVDGRVDRAAVTARSPVKTTTLSLRFSDWGDPAIKVATPTVAPNTAGVDADALARWRAAPLLMPRTVPAGWRLTVARILPADETVEGCEQVFIAYELTNDPEAGYLNLYQFPTACAQPFTGDGVVPFSAGPHNGSARYSPADGTLAQVTVGNTTLQADSDLSLNALARVLADVVPLNLKATPRQA